MPTNTKTNKEKAAIKRRQRARIKAGEKTEREKRLDTNLLEEMVNMKGQDPKVKAIARRAKKSIGAPTKLTPALCSRIIKYMVEGNYLSTSCKCAGVHHLTFTTWMKTAEAAISQAQEEFAAEAARLAEVESIAEAELKRAEAEGAEAEYLDDLRNAANTAKQASDELVVFDFVPEDRLLHVHLHQAVQMAEGEAERRLLRKASEGERGWQGAMAVMERRFREGWGKSSEINHKVSGDEERPVVFSLESDADRQRRVAGIIASAKPDIAHLDAGSGDEQVIDAEVITESSR